MDRSNNMILEVNYLWGYSQSGKAKVCKTLYSGSNPDTPSKTKKVPGKHKISNYFST